MLLVRGVTRSFMGGFPLVWYWKLNVGLPGTGILTELTPGGSRGAFLHVVSIRLMKAVLVTVICFHTERREEKQHTSSRLGYQETKRRRLDQREFSRSSRAKQGRPGDCLDIADAGWVLHRGLCWRGLRQLRPHQQGLWKYPKWQNNWYWVSQEGVYLELPMLWVDWLCWKLARMQYLVERPPMNRFSAAPPSRH